MDCDLGQASNPVWPPCHLLQMASEICVSSQDPWDSEDERFKDWTGWNEGKRVIINLREKMPPLKAETSRQGLGRKE